MSFPPFSGSVINEVAEVLERYISVALESLVGVALS